MMKRRPGNVKGTLFLSGTAVVPFHPPSGAGTTGRVSRFGGYPEMDQVRALTVREPRSCGTPPEPLVIDSAAAFERIISDAVPTDSEVQPADAAAYGLVLRVTSCGATEARYGRVVVAGISRKTAGFRH